MPRFTGRAVCINDNYKPIPYFCVGIIWNYDMYSIIESRLLHTSIRCFFKGGGK